MNLMRWIILAQTCVLVVIVVEGVLQLVCPCVKKEGVFPFIIQVLDFTMGTCFLLEGARPVALRWHSSFDGVRRIVRSRTPPQVSRMELSGIVRCCPPL